MQNHPLLLKMILCLIFYLFLTLFCFIQLKACFDFNGILMMYLSQEKRHSNLTNSFNNLPLPPLASEQYNFYQSTLNLAKTFKNWYLKRRGIPYLTGDPTRSSFFSTKLTMTVPAIFPFYESQFYIKLTFPYRL